MKQDKNSGGVIHEKTEPSCMDSISIRTLLQWGAALRLLLLIYSHFHDKWFRVKYTDIDYMIIVDGAKEMWMGGSPFDRTTFRYTPFLALLVLPSVVVGNPFGKLLFALCDLGAAYYSYVILSTFTTQRSAKWMISLFILFNPIVVNVSTRGNSDMVVTFMSLLVLAKYTQSKYYQAAAILGFAVHFKLYPIIYALPLVLGVWERTYADNMLQKILRVTPVVTLCGILVVTFFMIPTLLCYQWFGQQYLDEAFLYHVYREDHRHNFSPYWLLMYLNMARRQLNVVGYDYALGLFAFLPQALVLTFISYKLRRNIAHACCVETILFIAFNKVCTVQYFVWFIPFMSFLFYESLDGGEDNAKRLGVLKTVSVISLWGLMIPLWMLAALQLEFYGRSDFGKLWIVSCLFFLAMISVAARLARIAYRLQECAGEDNIRGGELKKTK